MGQASKANPNQGTKHTAGKRVGLREVHWRRPLVPSVMRKEIESPYGE